MKPDANTIFIFLAVFWLISFVSCNSTPDNEINIDKDWESKPFDNLIDPYMTTEFLRLSIKYDSIKVFFINFNIRIPQRK